MLILMKKQSSRKTRNPERTRAHILDVAFYEIYHYGFRGVSIDQIIKHTEVTKGAFFHHFATKNELGYALVDEVLREMILDRWIRPLAAYKNPVQGILKRFKILCDSMSDENLARGCPLNNLAQEMSAVDPTFREKIRAVMILWIDETERFLKKAQESGHFKEDVDTRQLAVFIVMFEEGAFGMVKSLGDRNIFDTLFLSFKNYLLSLTK